MKSLELQPTQDNILEAYLVNSIGRNASIKDFIAILSSIDGNYSIALDSMWGCGKTFFVNQVKMVLDEYNDIITLNKNNQLREIFENSTENELTVRPHVSVYYDSWLNDNDEDPILSLVYSIVMSTQQDFKETKNPDIFGIVGNIADVVTGRNISDLLKSFQNENSLAVIENQKNLTSNIYAFLDKVLVERGERLVIFIDELDRCKPTFAVKLLERIKHYFMHDKVTFVFSVNLSELQHTIKNLYGLDFNGSKYLERFFDFKVTLPSADKERYCKTTFFGNSLENIQEVYNYIITINNFELRDIAKFLTNVKRILDVYDEDYGNKNFSYSVHKQAEKDNIQYLYLYIFPVFIGIKIADGEKYKQLICGTDSMALLEMLKCKTFLNATFDTLIDFWGNNTTENPRDNIGLYLKKIYQALVSKDKNKPERIGNIFINENIRGALKFYTNFI